MKSIITLVTLLGLCSIHSVFADNDSDLLSESDLLLQERIRAHINFLADDLLRGRQPGTEGYALAAAYVASQFRQMGLIPAGADESYYQQVPLRRAWLLARSG
jgi:hypothetical protein